jgi:hypothetical protein
MKAPEDIYKALVLAGDKMANSEYEYRLLSDATKSILAQLSMDAKEVHGVNSQAEANNIALTAAVYRDHLAACALAHRIASKSKIAYYATRSYADHCRTAEASSRAAAGSAT